MQNKINISPNPKQNKMMQKVLKMHQSGHLDLAETYYKKLLNDWIYLFDESQVLLSQFLNDM